MTIDFSKLTRDSYGNIEPPTLILKRPHGEIIGVLRNAFNVKLELKYSELSEASFDYPYNDGSILLPFYDEINKDKIVEIFPYGVFIVDDYEDVNDGVRRCKSVSLRSYEYDLSTKHIVISEGVYNLWNPAAQDNTILHYVLQCAPGWKIGRVSSSLIGRYRTTSGVDSQVLDYLINEVQDCYDCVVIFDSFEKTINVIDIDETVPEMPIYLSHQNLIKQGVLKQLDEAIVTKLYVQGADGVDIRDVNPTGDNYIYNLDWYIENGDLPDSLVLKWRAWENQIFAQQPHYVSMVASRNTKMTQQLSDSAKLVDTRNKKAELENLRIVNVQAREDLNKEANTYQDTYDELTDRISEIEQQISDLDVQIATAEHNIKALQVEIDAINTDIAAINTELRIANYFTDNELKILDCYFKEGSFQDATFAVFDINSSADTSYKNIDIAMLDLFDTEITVVEHNDNGFIGQITKGTLQLKSVGLSEYNPIEASIVNGTVDIVQKDDSNILTASFYLSPLYVDGVYYGSGSLSITGAVSSIDSLLKQMDGQATIEYSADQTLSHYVNTYTGKCTIFAVVADVYMTQSVSEYQKYSIKQELYKAAKLHLLDVSRPLCEFEIDAANMINAAVFDQFRKNLRLGHSCYLQLQNDIVLKPVLIEVHLNVDDPTDFSLVFSNSFRRHEDIEHLRDVIRDVSTASRQFDSNKYNIEDSKVTTTWVKNLLQNGYQAALNMISAGKDNLVTIDGAGIKVASNDSSDVIQLNNGMIALIDKTKTPNEVKMAMGHFRNSATNMDFVGIMAEVIAGTLIAGQQLVIECETTDGIMQFKVDSSGVLINNGRWYMVSDTGCIAMDPKYGIAAGGTGLFVPVNSGNISISGVGSDGKLELDSDGQPVNTDINVWLGMAGDSYFRGDVTANNFYFLDGSDVRTILRRNSGSNKSEFDLSDLDYIDLGRVILNGDHGDEDTYAYIGSAGISLKRGHPGYDGEDGSDRINLEAIDSGKTYTTQLVLGTGSGNGDNGKLYLKKSATDVNGNGTTWTEDVGVYYNTSNGNKVGFQFHNDGELEVVADSVKGIYLTFS